MKPGFKLKPLGVHRRVQPRHPGIQQRVTGYAIAEIPHGQQRHQRQGPKDDRQLHGQPQTVEQFHRPSEPT